ncbi:MAG TPA: TolC family protein, partial [Bacillota bacterium]|nr:TolC family protein [Bacillota bacterium]
MTHKQNVAIIVLVVLQLLCGFGMPARAAAAQETMLTVEQAVDLALQHNQRWQLATGEVKIADEKAAQAKTGYLPKVTLSGGVSRLNQVPDIVEVGRKLADLNNGMYAMVGGMVRLAQEPQKSFYNQLFQQMSLKEGPDDGLTYYSINL